MNDTHSNNNNNFKTKIKKQIKHNNTIISLFLFGKKRPATIVITACLVLAVVEVWDIHALVVQLWNNNEQQDTTIETIINRQKPTDKIPSSSSTQIKDNDEKILPVFIYPNENSTLKRSLNRDAYDGLERSTKLELSYNHTMAQIWIVDNISVKRDDSLCEDFKELVQDAIKVKDTLSLLDDWKVIFLHWRDGSRESFNDCSQATTLIGANRIHRFKRSIVGDRRWNSQKHFIDPGYIRNYTDWHRHSAVPVEHISFGVRSAILNGLHQLFSTQQQQQQQQQQLDQHSHRDIVVSPEEFVRNTNRSTDVSYFWPLGSSNAQGISRLRDAVGLAIHQHLVVSSSNTTNTNNTTSNNYNIFIGLAGEFGVQGRRNVQNDYLIKLLDSKIVIVTQRDTWEDHNRLMEALVSGAMVMTDPMLSLPIGLKENLSIVYYRSMDDLILKIKYYLQNSKERKQIALEGYKVATEQHRSNHLLERIIFFDNQNK